MAFVGRGVLAFAAINGDGSRSEQRQGAERRSEETGCRRGSCSSVLEAELATVRAELAALEAEAGGVDGRGRN